MFQHLQIFLFALLVFVMYTHQQVQDAEFQATYSQYRSDCSKEAGLDVAFVTKVWDENHFPNDPKLKCYFKCMNLKFGVMDQNGDVIDDVLKKYSANFHDAATDAEIVTECGDIKGADLCETAFNLMSCIKNATLD